MPESIKDIAKEAGVYYVAVSSALGGNPLISNVTTREIREARLLVPFISQEFRCRLILPR
ncbi:MAG: LacI family DNA-binding transcriptional regulator [Anaerolineales bacterium]|nr:LacI family DNA-binding transcriptional regulator [Anaerolineales bacterium]